MVICAWHAHPFPFPTPFRSLHSWISPWPSLSSFLFFHISPSSLHLALSFWILSSGYTPFVLFPTDYNFPEIHYELLLVLGQKSFIRFPEMKISWVSFTSNPSPTLISPAFIQTTCILPPNRVGFCMQVSEAVNLYPFEMPMFWFVLLCFVLFSLPSLEPVFLVRNYQSMTIQCLVFLALMKNLGSRGAAYFNLWISLHIQRKPDITGVCTYSVILLLPIYLFLWNAKLEGNIGSHFKFADKSCLSTCCCSYWNSDYSHSSG